VAEIIQKQLGTYYGGQFLPPNLRERSLQLERTVRPAAAVTGDTYRDIGIQITNWNHGHSNNRAVDFTLVRNNGQISNPVPSPVSGRVIYSGRDGGFGNTIVIVADQDGPGYKKGDRVRVAHLAQLYFQAGAQVNRGRPIGKSGDTSPHDSVPGRSGTGAGDPGHVHIQIYKPGGGVPYTNSQYGQAYQNSFVRQNLVPLFKYNPQTNQQRSSINTQLGEQFVGQLQQTSAFEDVAMINPMVALKATSKLISPITKNIYQTYDRLFNQNKPVKSVKTGKPLDQNGRIAAAALAFKNQSTAAGPDGGKEACAWAINKVLKNAGVKVPWVEAGQESIYIPFIEDSIKKGAGKQINMEQAKPGDLITQDGSHLGVITKVSKETITFLSNSSSRASFSYGGDMVIPKPPKNTNTPLGQIEQTLYETRGKNAPRIYRLNPQK
jgi:murein DD-endopeptidase MepM/ murein hydrolase activator NlpD